jgi:hypothetical protein
VGNTSWIFCMLEHKRMSDVCDRYLIRARSTSVNQYASLRSAISTVIQRQGWKVKQIGFITGVRENNNSRGSNSNSVSKRSKNVSASALKTVPYP